eukprot:283537-Chlamydomonas_euryale.AAC.1
MLRPLSDVSGSSEGEGEGDVSSSLWAGLGHAVCSCIEALPRRSFSRHQSFRVVSKPLTLRHELCAKPRFRATLILNTEAGSVQLKTWIPDPWTCLSRVQASGFRPTVQASTYNGGTLP